MKFVQVCHYDAFSNEPNKGNPAGVVLDANELTDAQMQDIASRVGFNETAFICKSAKADFKIRYFTPGHEMDLCGHATIATIYALTTKGLIANKTEITIDTNIGVLPISISKSPSGEAYITMQHAPPQFEAFLGSKKDLAQSLGIAENDIDDEFPIVYGSTGVWTLLVPIKYIDIFKNMKPNNQLFPSILRQKPKVSIHPFCFETYSPNTDIHARHFSSPFSGTIEDPVTGTASGVMGAYFAKYIEHFDRGSQKFVIEQGQEINKDGKVIVEIATNDNNFDVKITGSAVYVKDFTLDLANN